MDDCGAGNMPAVLESYLVDFCQAQYADLNRWPVICQLLHWKALSYSVSSLGCWCL